MIMAKGESKCMKCMEVDENLFWYMKVNESGWKCKTVDKSG